MNELINEQYGERSKSNLEHISTANTATNICQVSSGQHISSLT